MILIFPFQYQESQQNTTSVIHGPVVANPPRTVSGGVTNISLSTNGSVQNGPSDKYKQLYEKEREENEKLRKMIEQMNMKSGDLSNGTSRPNSSMDDHDKRTLERKIAQLEYELEVCLTFWFDLAPLPFRRLPNKQMKALG